MNTDIDCQSNLKLAGAISGLRRASLAISIAVSAASLGYVQTASADTCVIQGRYQIESKDTFYCDTDRMGSAACAGWKQVNVDRRGTQAPPMRYTAVRIRNAQEHLHARTFTDHNGYFSATINVDGACANRVMLIEYELSRIHESYVNGPPSVTGVFQPHFAPLRFNVRTEGYGAWKETKVIILGGYQTTYNRTIPVNGSSFGKAASIYQIADSMVSEVVQWSSTIDATFDNPNTFTVRTGHGGYAADANGAYIPFTWASKGFLVRRGIAEPVLDDLHGGNQRTGNADSCFSEDHANHAGTDINSCEWGSKATRAALIEFIALRSATWNDKNVWTCTCEADASRGHGQDICSLLAASSFFGSDADALMMPGVACTGGHIRGVGDNYASSTSSCLKLKQTDGCDCNNGGTCEESFRLHHGWKNTTQVLRFLWDMIDSNNEGGKDNTDLSMSQFVALLDNMPCSGSDAGVNGSCNEPNGPSALSCTPYNAWTTSGWPYSSTRHAYNVWDIGIIVPGNQTGERVVNCVDGAR